MLPNKFWVILKLIPRVANQSCVHHLIFGLNKIDFIEGVQGGPRGRSPLAVRHFRTTLRFKLSILKLSWPAECTANSTNNFLQAGQLRRDDLTTNKSTACQHYLQRPRGTSRVFHGNFQSSQQLQICSPTSISKICLPLWSRSSTLARLAGRALTGDHNPSSIARRVLECCKNVCSLFIVPPVLTRVCNPSDLSGS